MKCLDLILVILATIFIYQTEAKPSTALNHVEKIIHETIEFLNDYEHHLEANVDDKFSKLFDKKREAISADVNNALQLIQEIINDANLEGEEAEKCSQSTQSSLNEAQTKILSVLEKCFRSNKPELSSFHTEIKLQIETGEKLRNMLIRIREECAADSSNEEKCIVRQLPKVARLVASYKIKVEKMKVGVELAIAKALKNIAVCTGLPMISFKIEVKSVIHAAKECIKSA